ncbi:MAG: malectin domain-containing carbohydrate-binding protein, partial [Algisphaera sp.]
PLALFQTERWDKNTGQEMQWDFPVTPGQYQVNLYFAEISNGITNPGQRVFNVNIDNTNVLSNYDTLAESGAFAAQVKSFNINNTDGNIDIDFARITDNPAIKGIEILAATPVNNANVLDASDSVLDFGTVNINGADATQNISFTNAGTTGDPDITLSTANLAGSNAANFSIAATHNGSTVNLPGLVLNPGQTVVVSLTFDPSAAGNANANFTLNHSGNNAPESISLIGIGSDPAVNQPPTLAPINANLSVIEGQTLTLALSATDPDPGDSLTFSATGLPSFANIVSTGNHTANLVFTPALGQTGPFGPFDITVTDNGSPALADTQANLNLTVNAQPSTGDVLYRVNAGGPAVDAQDSGPNWLADNPDSAFSNASAAVSRRHTHIVPINLTHPSVPTNTPQVLFQTERFDLTSGQEMQWDFAVTPGLYEVRLYFAEISNGITGPGQRIFDVNLEGLTVLNDYDTFAQVGGFKGQVKSYVVNNTDGNIDINFDHVQDNPSIKAIEILNANIASTLGAQLTELNYGLIPQQETSTATATVYNLGNLGDPNITLTGAVISQADFSVNPNDVTNVVIPPGTSHSFDIALNPQSSGPLSGTLTLNHDGDNAPLSFALDSVVLPGSTIAFGRSTAVTVGDPTSFQFGPDGRLYVGRRHGTIDIFNVVRNGPNDYSSTLDEQINLVRDIDNHNDQGVPEPTVNGRLITGIYVAGTAANPIVYATSSDPRTGGGDVFLETGIDTNSGMVSQLTFDGSSWNKVDLIRGLPRSDEFHSTNGLQLDASTNTLYVAVGGNTNSGGPSNNFGFLPEYAYSAAILSVDLTALNALPTLIDPVHGNAYKYNLPTLDDEDRNFGTGPGGDTHLATGVQDVFGGNNGKNQAKLTTGSPVQIFASGFRNPYDLVITESDRIYSIDNGPNGGWGAPPILSDNGTPSNPNDDYATNDLAEGGISLNDNLHRVTPGFYGGHPNPARASLNNTFNPSNPQAAVDVADPQQSFFAGPDSDGSLANFDFSTNGIAEYTSSAFNGALQGDLLAASHDGTVKRIKLSPDGTSVTLVQTLFNNVGVVPLDLTIMGDNDPFPGTVWVGDLVTNTIFVFEPESSGGDTSDPNGDADGDGYTNFDEASNGTNPTSSGDVPADFDADYTSNLLDPNDDNDALSDVSDPFAIDPDNGTTHLIGTFLDFESGVQGGLLGLGFTGIMNNGNGNYDTQFSPNGLTAGGAAGVLTVDQATAGTAQGNTNTQDQAFQLGVNVANATDPFTATTRMLAPFNTGPAQPGQEIGFYIGTGDQDNYLQLILTGDGTNTGARIELGHEVAGVFNSPTGTSTSLGSFTNTVWIDLYLRIDPTTQTAQASYRINDGSTLGPRINLGSPVSLAGLGWLDQPLAIGIISTSSVPVNVPADRLSATWNHLGLLYDAPSVLAVDIENSSLLATPPNTSLTRTLTFTNQGLPDTGAPAITLTAASLSGPAQTNFAHTFNGPITLEAGESTDFEVTFSPTSLGDALATLNISHSGTHGNTTLALTGRGVPDTASATLSLQTGGGSVQSASTSTSGGITLTNTSTSNQQIQRVVIDLSTGFFPNMVFDPDGFGGDTTAKDFTPESGHLAAGLAYWAFEGHHGGGYDRLVLAFDDFNPGESITFSVDIDPNSIKGVPAPGPHEVGAVSGLESVGATVDIDFNDGSKTTRRIVPVAGSGIAGIATVSNQPVPATPLIELVGLGTGTVTTNTANPTVRATGTPGRTVRVWVVEAGLFVDGVPGGGWGIEPFETNSAVAVRETTAVIGAGGTVDVNILLTETTPQSGNHHVFAVVENGAASSDPSNVVLVRYTP